LHRFCIVFVFFPVHAHWALIYLFFSSVFGPFKKSFFAHFSLIFAHFSLIFRSFFAHFRPIFPNKCSRFHIDGWRDVWIPLQRAPGAPFWPPRRAHYGVLFPLLGRRFDGSGTRIGGFAFPYIFILKFCFLDRKKITENGAKLTENGAFLK
jgi:hypothetical protein